MRKSSVECVEFLSKEEGRVLEGITARITKDTDLVIPAKNGIRPERADHRHPGHWRVLKTVHEQDRNLVWSIRLDLYQSHRIGELLRVQHRREPNLLRMLARKTQSYWRSEIRTRW